MPMPRLAAALLVATLAACCPAPAGVGPATDAEGRLRVRTAPGAPAADGARPAHADGVGAVRLLPAGDLALPADASLYVIGRPGPGGAFHVEEFAALPGD